MGLAFAGEVALEQGLLRRCCGGKYHPRLLRALAAESAKRLHGV